MNTAKIALYTDSDEMPTVSATEAIMCMFEHTDETGTLYIPAWHYDYPVDCNEKFYKCAMNWNKADAEHAVAAYRNLYAALEKIAEKRDAVDSEADITDLSDEIQAVWRTYMRKFETGDMDIEQISDILEKYDTIAAIKRIADSMADKAEITKEAMDYYNEYKDTAVTETEKKLYDEYRNAVYTDSEKRIGKSPAAYDVIVRTQRLCRLMSLQAPEMIIQNEAILLAEAMVIHTYCAVKETVDTVE